CIRKRLSCTVAIQHREGSAFIISQTGWKRDQGPVLGESILQRTCRTISDSGYDSNRIAMGFQLLRIEPDDVKRISAAKDQMSGGQITRAESAAKDHLRLARIKANSANAGLGPALSHSNRVQCCFSAGQNERPAMIPFALRFVEFCKRLRSTSVR